ncbi:MAG: hypothetical protein UV42_C0024G0008 [Candidatus Magasanikbacteria bacterium GW2011_GWE2_42_7]|uniref:SpaA-like prealbumin fold domain-containing protein n=1 Tax=Candidatus Magasanikbacteria bacterium GW2011_GWE2_42_7 TaxID=1619052 RepID=A0A0G1DL96_9BACT|nr:MAG: hypothetical protein UV42_C0024G0008 [Candidatus Magasanikbacteria bacterium GW2011_GWE2_42_7]
MNLYKKSLHKHVIVTVLVFSLIIGFTWLSNVSAVIPPDRTFGITNTYSVYGHAGITNADAGTRVWGNVGDNNVGYAGFTAIQVPDGIINTTTASGTAIENDASSVYDSLMSATQGTPAGVVTSLDLAGTHTVLNGNPITPGVYNVGATTLNGAVELSGAGVYIFRSSASLTIATSGGTMTLSNGATPCNVFWAVPASMTIGTGSHIEGTIIAKTGLISLATGASLVGRAISLVSQVTLDNNQITEPTCTPIPATLHVVKTVINDNGGTATSSDFTLNVTGTNVSTSSFAGSATGVDVTLDAGTYEVAESIVPTGYSQTASADCSGTIAFGETKTCTITNDDITPHLIVKKTVITDNGGTATSSDFTLNVTGTNVATSSFAGSAVGVDVTLDAGTYEVTEPIVPVGYSQTGSGDCSGTIALGETKTCTITNDDIAPQLVVNKLVVNDSGRTKVISDFPLFIDGVSVTSGVASTTVIGLHTVSETADSGYTSSIGGDDCAADGTITLALGDVKTCTIVNDDIAQSSGGGGGSYYAPVPPLIDVCFGE